MAGVPMMSALKGLEGSGEDKAIARMMRDLREGLESGHDLSTCLLRYPKVFDAFYVAMAVTIVFGLLVATVLTMIVVPVLYAIFFNARKLPEAGA